MTDSLSHIMDDVVYDALDRLVYEAEAYPDISLDSIVEEIAEDALLSLLQRVEERFKVDVVVALEEKAAELADERFPCP